MRKITLFLCFFFSLQLVMAQRNGLKFGYSYNALFSDPVLIQTVSEDVFNLNNHAYAFGIERTIGNRISVGLSYYIPGVVKNLDNPFLYDGTEGNYRVTQEIKGSGFMYESKYFFSDHDDGAPDGGYFSINLGSYSMTNQMKVADAGYGLSNPIYMGDLKHDMKVNKVGFRFGVEKVNGLLLAEYYFGADMNFWTESFDKSTRLTQFTETKYKNTLSYTMGILIGLSL